ncbi:hypothetical protein JCM16358_13050 [Halanaerocella petrolearia]
MMRLGYWLYDLLLIILFILYSPVILYKVVVKGKYKEGLAERFGFLPQVIKDTFSQEPTIWIHAASVGETGAANPVVSELRKRYPEHKLLFSTMTETGQGMAEKIIKEADGFIYLPLDLPSVVNKVIKIINPELVVIMETELWPNLIRYAKREGSQVMIASGRISDESYKQYKYLGPLLADLLDKVDAFAMQSREDAERIIELGASQDKVYNYGNTKFDQDYGQADKEKKEEIYQEYKLDPNQPILVAGSTHDDEEEQLISLYQRLKEEEPDLVFILAPRYVERADEIEELYNQAGIETVQRSSIEDRDASRESVIIVDTIGELAQLYGIGDLVFVGGSLIERGGHNLLEPALQGKLVFFGPHMFNFKDSTRLLLKHQVGVQVEGVEQLTEEMLYYLTNQEELRAKSRQAIEMIEENQGAAKRNIELASELLKPKILIVRLSAIGDVIHALPVARAVRESYPEAEISWIVEEKAKDLVVDNPNLDQVILLTKAEWKDKFKENKWQTLKEFRSFFKELQKNDFDLVLDVHGLFKSGLTAYLSGADRIVGPADGREGSTLFYDRKVELPAEEMHQVDRNLYLAQGIGANSKQVGFDIQVSSQEKKEVDKLLSDLNLNLDKNTIAINPFTSWTSKNWPQVRYAQLADRLIEESACQILFTGSPDDREGVAEIISMMDNKAYNLAGETNLKELAEVYNRVDYFIGGDTGPMHLAVAMGLPVVALFGPTTPKTHGPYGDQNIVVQPEIECIKCWKRECPKDELLCMEQIEVEQVFQAVSRVQ